MKDLSVLSMTLKNNEVPSKHFPNFVCQDSRTDSVYVLHNNIIFIGIIIKHVGTLHRLNMLLFILVETLTITYDRRTRCNDWNGFHI